MTSVRRQFLVAVASILLVPGIGLGSNVPPNADTRGARRLPAHSDSWPQFRGPNASGIAVGEASLPSEIGPETNVIWKTPLPAGHSSPVVVGGRVFVTGFDGERLLTIALDRQTGKIAWQREAPYDELEQIHTIGSHAQPSPAADERVVVTFFGSSGMYCYDHDGELLWERPMGPFKNTFGAGSSPILVDDRVILNQDHDIESFLIAVDKSTGKTIWRKERPEFPRGFTTPIIRRIGGRREIVVAGALRLVGYDFETGRELWSVSGLARIANMTPVLGEEGTLYVAGWSPGGDESDRIESEPLQEFFERYDANESGTIELDELPAGPMQSRFSQIDRDKDEQITPAEYDWMREIFETAQNAMLAVKPGGRGDITASHVLWRHRRYLPYVPSPVYYKGTVFMIKDGGILSSLDADSGALVKFGRVPHTGQYYSSPVVGDGKLYTISRNGGLAVFSARPQWKKLHSARFDEEVYATPALVDGRVFVRTAGRMYCFDRP